MEHANEKAAMETIPDQMTDRITAFLDLEVPMKVQIGEIGISLERISSLKEGDTIEFEKAAGEPLDVMVGTVRLFTGEIVVIEDRLAIRITDIEL